MSTIVTISDELAALLDARRREAGHESLDSAAEALIARGILADAQEDHNAGHSDEELRALIDQADASGPLAAWDSETTRADILRRYAGRRT